jgi:hypothetical protein
VTSADEVLTSQTLGRMITIEVVNQLAEREGVEVTQGQIDEQLAAAMAQTGDMAAVEQVYIEQSIAPSQIESFVTLNIQAQQLGMGDAHQIFRLDGTERVSSSHIEAAT